MTLNTIAQTFDGVAVTHMQCWCGVSFAIPKTLRDHYEREAGRFTLYCPLGHGMVPAGKSEADRLRDELAREKHRTEQAKADADWNRRRVEQRDRQLAARKGQLTKLRNRVGRGVCPCCNRYFADLHRHMETKHTDWRPEADPAAVVVPDTVAAADRLYWQQGAEAAMRGESPSANPHSRRGRWARRYRAWNQGHDAAMAAAATPTGATEGGR